MGATNIMGRVAASMGALNEVPLAFTPCLDLSFGGVLFSLPVLLATGLLRHTGDLFRLGRGYYGLQSIFLLLAFMALARIKTIESLRYYAPGEWGKLLGLDRIPEVRTLREKIKLLSCDNQPQNWSAQLCADWMDADPTSAGTLYVDGHVRVYHGHQTALPRHYVARQRLCQRATTDYWVNAMDSQPFFVTSMAVDPGLLQVLRNDIIPRLEREVPSQPSSERLKENPLLHRFTVVFDREGYSPDFLLEMKNRRIACLTYHKYPAQNWPEEEFQTYKAPFPNGNIIEMKLAERGIFLSNKIWLREIRKLTSNGHQTSILATNYVADIVPIAMGMFSRWSQENFFRYMREHYNLDRLIDYGVENISDTTKVVNPEYRRLDSQQRSKTSVLNRKLAQFGAINLDGEISSEKVTAYQEKKANLQEDIKYLQEEIDKLKERRKDVAHHITVSELPEEERFQRLSVNSKHLIDTIKMTAYRSETAMANTIKEKMSRTDDARSLLRAIYRTEADLLPDYKNGTLTVQLHHLANHSSDEAVRYLCDELNSTETIFPGTNLRLIFKSVSSQIP